MRHNNIFILGNSHIYALKKALSMRTTNSGNRFYFYDMVDFGGGTHGQTGIDESGKTVMNPAIFNAMNMAALSNNPNGSNYYFSMIGGNDHNNFGFLQYELPFNFSYLNSVQLPPEEKNDILPTAIIEDALANAMELSIQEIVAFRTGVSSTVFHIESPPPIDDDDFIKKNMDAIFKETGLPVSPPAFRHKLWLMHSQILKKTCAENDICFIPAPEASMDENGFLRKEYYSDNVTHANAKYGELVLQQIEAAVNDSSLFFTSQKTVPPPSVSPTVTPYSALPEYAHWRRAVSGIAQQDVDPVVNFKFKIKQSDKVASAGSCFAQHISKNLSSSGFHYYIAEPGHALLTPEFRKKYNYGVFSARYGNIYTSRQLVQLFDRAFGLFVPKESPWQTDEGRFVDPFRPTVQPQGFINNEDFVLDRERHLHAVRQMFQNMDYFIFTLGLTECWESTIDGAVFPLCPGVVGGKFDSSVHRFLNLDLADVVTDLMMFVNKLKKINQKARLIFTVSPVPLMATAANQHVLLATTYSKSVLRIACDVIEKRFPNVAYFPSFEIITSSFSQNGYFESDKRTVTQDGVNHVMRLFNRHATECGENQATRTQIPDSGCFHGLYQNNRTKAEEMMQLLCDEERY